MAANFQRKLNTDHSAVLNPDFESPFTDYEDVLNRLVPYHVFQQPWQDVQAIIDSCRRKGKTREMDDDALELDGELHISISVAIPRLRLCSDTKFAIDCFKRRRKLKERFVETITRSGKVGCRISFLHIGC